MTYIIHGATGAQGSPVYAALVAAGHDVTAAVRDASAFDGTAVAVDYSSVPSLEAAYRGADGVFIHLPIGTPDQQRAYAEAIVTAVTNAQPTRVVASTSGYGAATDDDSPVSVLVRGLRASGVSVAIVEPRLYLENLLLPTVVAPLHDEGVLRYPLRDDYAVSWSSHLDVADVVVRLLADHSVTGSVAIGALPALLGADLAAGFAAHLGRDVRFEAQDPDDFGALITPLFGAEGTAPVVAGYRWRLTQADDVIDEARSAQKLLSLEPRSVSQWLRDVGV